MFLLKLQRKKMEKKEKEKTTHTQQQITQTQHVIQSQHLSVFISQN